MGLGTLSVVLLLWQWGAQRYTSVILPSPGEVAIALQGLFRDGLVGGAIAATSTHVFIGFALALMVGGLLGLAVGQQPWLQPAIAPIAVALLGTPPIAWLVLTMVWFGLNSTNSIFTVAVTVAPIVFAGVVDAVVTLDAHLLAVAQVYQLRGRSRFQCLYWPHLVSRLLPVCVTGLGIGWRVSIMSEVLATPVGIGAEMNTARANLDTASVMAWIVITIILVLTSDTLLRLLQQRLLPWRRDPPRGVTLRHPSTRQMGAAP
ncbi:MAG: ABC transporter permease subunit [Cyanothece sp. SIO2G6]|nr:ABC transporter permease subunit [Cyanothece sp. SIO2G6]